MTKAPIFPRHILAYMSLRTISGFYCLQYFHSQDILELAFLQIEHHDTSEALLEIMIQEDCTCAEMYISFRDFLQEVNIHIPSQLEAFLIVAQYYAQNILNETVSPLDGARKIWFEICNEVENPSEILTGFRTLASEIEDTPMFSEHNSLGNPKFKDLEEEIRVLAKNLLEIEPPDLLSD